MDLANIDVKLSTIPVLKQGDLVYTTKGLAVITNPYVESQTGRQIGYKFEYLDQSRHSNITGTNWNRIEDFVLIGIKEIRELDQEAHRLWKERMR